MSEVASTEEPVISEDQVGVVCEVGYEPGLFLVPEGYAFVVVIGDRAEGDRRLLRQRLQALLLDGDGNALGSMNVEHAAHVGSSVMDGAVNDEAGWVERIGAGFDLLTVIVGGMSGCGKRCRESQPSDETRGGTSSVGW